MSLLFMLGIVQNVAGVTLFYSALRRLPAAEVTLLALLEPVLGPIWVWLFVGEEPAFTTLIGGAVVLGALAVKCIADLRRHGSAAAAATSSHVG
jgi:drug/metabolite transporter (DMT)-like permease